MLQETLKGLKVKEYEARKNNFLESLNESYGYLCDTLEIKNNGVISSWLDISHYYKASDIIESEEVDYDELVSLLEGVVLAHQIRILK